VNLDSAKCDNLNEPVKSENKLKYTHKLKPFSLGYDAFENFEKTLLPFKSLSGTKNETNKRITNSLPTSPALNLSSRLLKDEQENNKTLNFSTYWSSIPACLKDSRDYTTRSMKWGNYECQIIFSI
jgi:hypothetical protein